MSWTETSSGLRFALKRDDQRVLNFGPFRAEIARLALAYAADGRPVTVTMPAAGIGRAILLHPALVDTSLGCRARHLDQFVDTFTARTADRQSAEQRVSNHLATYKYAWAVQFSQVFARGELSDRDKENVRDENAYAEKIVASEEVQKAVTTSLRAPDDWSNAKLSPVTTKIDYFESSLVRTIGNCLKTANSVDAFGQCVARQPIDREFVRSGKWTAGPPLLFSESGVRELSYAIDPELSFLDINAQRGSTWPFDFMLQVTFESPRYFANTSGAINFDEKPFEYPNIKSWINDRVAQGISTDRSALQADKTMTDLREFAVLQRFFRLALDGKLGQTFPLNKLVELGQIKPRIQPALVRTPLWNRPEETAEILRENQAESLVLPLGLTKDMQQDAAQREACPDIQP